MFGFLKCKAAFTIGAKGPKTLWFLQVLDILNNIRIFAALYSLFVH